MFHEIKNCVELKLCHASEACCLHIVSIPMDGNFVNDYKYSHLWYRIYLVVWDKPSQCWLYGLKPHPETCKIYWIKEKDIKEA